MIEDNEVLKDKLSKLSPALDTINRLSAERSRYLRKLKKAGISC